MENTTSVNLNADKVIDSIKDSAQENDFVQTTEDTGAVNIADEVVAVISSMAANDVDGVAGMVGGVTGSFAELLGKKNLSKGVRTVRDGDDVTVFLAVFVEYGAKIPDVSWNLQTKVKNDIEAMTGLNVKAVNVSVDGITLVEKENKQNEVKQSEDKQDAAEEDATKADAVND